MPADNVIQLHPHAPRSDASTVRLTIERLQGMQVTGWALDPATPGQERITLRCGSTLLPAALRRKPRADVRQALGVDAPALGFELDLPTSIWKAMAESGDDLQVLVNDVAPAQPRLQPTLKSLEDWMRRVERHADPTQRDLLLAALRPHLDEARQWRSAAAAVLTEADEMPAPCHLEGWQGLWLSGWVADTPRRRETIRLRCNDRVLDCPVQRISRRDVAQALLLEHEDIGFLLEVPGTVWQQAGDELNLQVVVGQRACGAPLTLRRDQLSDRLDQALALTEPARRSHQGLLAMEHLVLAGELGGLDPTLRHALEVLAAAAGVDDWLAPQGPADAQAAATPRQPLRLGPRGRLGRWLSHPARAEAALRLLRLLQSKPWLARQAEALEIRLTLSLGLFDKALYEEQVSEQERGGLPALRHYVREGDARSLVPMCLFDPRHYTGQLEGRRHPGINRLLHYGLWGRFHELSPCGWFDADYYRDANRDVQESRIDPLVHFTRWGWQEHRRPHPDFEPTVGARQGLMQRLGRAQGVSHADPLINYLLEGLPADGPQQAHGRLPWMAPTRLDGRDYLDLAPWRSLPPRPAAPVLDVIVPVYAGAQETLRCLWSVLSAPVQMPFELVVIDDCSPEPALSRCLRELQALGLLTLLANPDNLGFVATVNRGLALHGERDVVILNADTRVHPGWLDRLAAHAVAEPRAASITPLSNNATICSYPRKLHSNWERIEVDDAALDALAADCNRGRHVAAPTGVGFCMWMRRSCLEAIGPLDVEHFGRGYGEENDWCMRANAAGWLQLIAADVYVMHQGSVSFRAEASERTRAALAVLLQRHPDYQQRVDAWITADPLRNARARLDAARLRHSPAAGAPLGTVLMISHARGGGTARHELEQAERLRRERGLGTVFLRPSRLKGHVALSAPDVTDLPNLDALPLRAEGPLMEILRALGLKEVQLHHLADHVPALRELLPVLCERLGVPLKITLHDYHVICPRINLVDATGRYCGEPPPAVCDRCLQGDAEGRAAGPIAAWREAHRKLLERAGEVIAPDRDVSLRLAKYFPALPVQVRPHEPVVELPPRRGGAGPVRQVLVVGALSVIKGYEVLLGLALSPVSRASGLQFTLLGHSPNDRALRDAGVTVLGRYDDEQLVARIGQLQPDLVLLPSVWPETYSYVLTAAMKTGLRIAVFDLGAPARRLRAAGADAVLLPVELAAHPDLLVSTLIKAG